MRVAMALLSVVALLAVLLAFRTLHRSSSSGNTPLVRPLSETPGSSHAVVFSTAAGRSADLDFLQGQLELQHYSVDQYTVLNGRATAANFKAALAARPGVLFVAGDAAPGFLAVEKLADANSCSQAVTGYVTAGAFGSGEITCHNLVLGITSAGIRAAFQDKETIVYLSACDSVSLQSSFTNARDFVGYRACGSRGLATSGDRRFWARLAGTSDGGRFRSTMTAADRGDYGSLWQFRHRPQTLDTVLSPSVAQVVPAAGTVYPVAGSTSGQVLFDARMDQTGGAADVVSVTGCSGAVTNPHWITTARGYSGVVFGLQLTTPGTAVLTVHAASAQAAREFQNMLDGNTDPRGTDGVGPNGDDFVWRIGCVPGGSQVPFPTITPGEAVTTTPLPVATTSPSTSTPGAGAGTGAGAGGAGGGGGTGGGGAPGGGGATGGGAGGGTGTTSPAGVGSSSGPTCGISAFRNTPAPATQSATVQASAGLASISGVFVNNGTVSVPHFAVGTKSAVVVVATKSDQTKPTEWGFDATDVAGRTTHCR
jgi:hypothetical protein